MQPDDYRHQRICNPINSAADLFRDLLTLLEDRMQSGYQPYYQCAEGTQNRQGNHTDYSSLENDNDSRRVPPDRRRVPTQVSFPEAQDSKGHDHRQKKRHADEEGKIDP